MRISWKLFRALPPNANQYPEQNMTSRNRTHRKLGAEPLEARQLLHGGALAGGIDRPSVAERVESAFSRLDTNEDSLLTTEDEISERLWERISAADTDDNGVTQEELLAHVETQIAEREESGRRRMGRRGGRGPIGQHGPRPSLARQSPSERLDNLFANADENEDGLLTSDEVSERLWERLSPADTNDDGVSREELDAYREAQRAERFDAAFARLDADESGGITMDEVSERRWTRLSAADADEDGAVTKQELQDHLEAKRAEREAENEEAPSDGDATDPPRVNNFAQRVQRFARFRR